MFQSWILAKKELKKKKKKEVLTHTHTHTNQTFNSVCYASHVDNYILSSLFSFTAIKDAAENNAAQSRGHNR